MIYTVEMTLTKYVQVQICSDEPLFKSDILAKARQKAIHAYGIFDDYEITDIEEDIE